jgi:hypothetical protein
MKSIKEDGKAGKAQKGKGTVTLQKTTKKDKTRIYNFTHDDIREKANEIYLQRIDRNEYGTPESDWNEAEIFLRESEN